MLPLEIYTAGKMEATKSANSGSLAVFYHLRKTTSSSVVRHHQENHSGKVTLRNLLIQTLSFYRQLSSPGINAKHPWKDLISSRCLSGSSPCVSGTGWGSHFAFKNEAAAGTNHAEMIGLLSPCGKTALMVKL